MPKPNILLAFNSDVRRSYLDDQQLVRLESFATWDWFECEGGGIESASDDEMAAAQLAEQIADYDGLIVCQGSPPLTPEIFDKAEKLRIVGETPI